MQLYLLLAADEEILIDIKKAIITREGFELCGGMLSALGYFGRTICRNLHPLRRLPQELPRANYPTRQAWLPGGGFF
jgi:hypothetical protein